MAGRELETSRGVLAVVPAARPSSVFEAHRRSLLFTALLFHAAAIGLPFLLSTPGLLFGSLGAAALGSFVGLGLTLAMLGRGALIGNARLERKIRARLFAPETGLEFVGICELENNALERRIRRFETDDNVGLLALTDDALVVVTEDGRIQVPRKEISAVTLEPLPDYPRLSWVRIEFDRDVDRYGFLIMSREAKTLPEIRERTERLYHRLVAWHAESQLAWLERARRAG